jgi:hypothetical protein
MPPPPVAKRPGQKDIKVVRCNFQYQAQRPDELSVEEGDVL